MSITVQRDGREWLFSDGTRLPVVSGGSDAGEPALGGEAPAPASAEGVPPSSGPSPASEAPPWGDKTIEQVWDKNGELIKENTSYKERWKPYEETFSTLQPEHADFYRGLASAHASGDAEAVADYVAEIQRFYGLTKAQARQVAGDATGEPASVDPRKIAQEEVQKYAQSMGIERAKADLAAHAQTVATKVGLEELGVAGSDLNSLLYFRANQVPNEKDPKVRLERAAEQIKESLEKLGQKMIAQKATTAAAGPSPAPADAGAPSGAQKPKSFKQARAAAEEWRRRQTASGQLGT